MSNRPLLDVFLDQILNCVRAKNGQGIADLIQLDFDSLNPSRQPSYSSLNSQLITRYPKGNDAALSARCKQALPPDELGSFHSSFSESLLQYFRYLRDFPTTNNLVKAQEIRQLTSQCITALGDSKYGVIMIPIVLSFSRVLGAIATNLDRNPSLTQQSTAGGDAEGGTGKVSFVESTANVLRDAFIKCLAGSPGTARTSRPAPDDKRYGIYLTANSCFRMLFRCRKLRNAQQMFLSIDAQSPPLSFYPAAQRVTYLYYLGRYHFANNHFYRAQATLQTAYDECHRDAYRHRRLILIYLVTSNICLGRFPSIELMKRREARDIAHYFLSLCKIIKSGDLGTLRDYLQLSEANSTAQWFLQKQILLQLQNRCEILTWRNLIRKVFNMVGFKGEEKKIPFLRLNAVRAAAQWTLSRSNMNLNPAPTPNFAFGSTIPPSTSTPYIDPDFQDLSTAIAETGFDVETGTYNDDAINTYPPSSALPAPFESTYPSLVEIEALTMSLIQQSLLRGFVLHTPDNLRFAVPGSARQAGGVMKRGFPAVWEVVRQKADGDGDVVVPGWVSDDLLIKTGSGAGRQQLGGVVRLSGARAVGVGS